MSRTLQGITFSWLFKLVDWYWLIEMKCFSRMENSKIMNKKWWRLMVGVKQLFWLCLMVIGRVVDGGKPEGCWSGWWCAVVLLRSFGIEWAYCWRWLGVNLKVAGDGWW